MRLAEIQKGDRVFAKSSGIELDITYQYKEAVNYRAAKATRLPRPIHIAMMRS